MDRFVSEDVLRSFAICLCLWGHSGQTGLVLSLLVCVPRGISADTAFLVLCCPRQDHGRCQPRFDVTHHVGSLCGTHHTTGTLDPASLCVVLCVAHVFKRLTDHFVQSSAALCFFFTCFEEVDRALRALCLCFFATRFAIISNHKSTTTVRELLRRRSCLKANLVMFTRHIVGFLVPCNSHLPLIPLSVMRYGACRRSERRRCAWTWPLQRKVIHDTIESLNEDGGLGWALSPVLARHIAAYCVCFTFLHEYEAVTTLSPTPGRLLFGGRVAAPLGRHCPDRVGCSSKIEWLLSPEGTARKALLRALRRLPPRLRAARRCCCASIIAGLGVNKLARRMTTASSLHYFR